MDWRFILRSAEPRLLCLFFLLAVLALLQVDAECKIDNCSSEYSYAIEKNEIEEPEHSVAFCKILREFRNCVISSKKECHSTVLYHTYVTFAKELSSSHNCSALIGAAKPTPGGPIHSPSIIPHLPVQTIPAPSQPEKSCTFHGKRNFRYCSLFGDPHLKTFNSHYQTCKLNGAWPLLDNPHVAVSVTNEAVIENSPATVTTKITVIIKGRGRFCAEEKTYEAQSDQALSNSFIDGTTSSGPNGSVTLNLKRIDETHQMIEIYLRYIETHLIIRKVGKYLAFAASVPEEVVLTEGEGLKLCNSGCPKSELLNFAYDHGDVMPWEEALQRCQDSTGLHKEISNQLTDHYLDWCVFDLMTTGELAPAHFTAAAHSAQADVLRFDPNSLMNRTTTKLRPRDVNKLSNNGVISHCHLRILPILVAVAFNVVK